jgi:hypothetical protein
VEPEELMAYLDGELEGARAEVAAEHLERCEECRGVAEELRGIGRALSGWEVEECRVREIRRTAKRRWWRWKYAWAAVPVMGALLVVMVRLPRTSSQADIAMPQQAQAFVSYGKLVAVTPLIARTAQLELVARDFARTRKDIESVVTRHHGYFGEMAARADSGAPQSLTAKLQIPSTELPATLAELNALARVVSETQTAEDVTRQSADLNARLANARLGEGRLRELMNGRTGKVSEVLEVERELARVRGEIERMEAERRGFTGRVDMATILATLREDGSGGSLGASARNGWRILKGSVSGAAEFALEFGPAAILWATPLALIGLWWRRRRRR